MIHFGDLELTALFFDLLFTDGDGIALSQGLEPFEFACSQFAGQAFALEVEFFQLLVQLNDHLILADDGPFLERSGTDHANNGESQCYIFDRLGDARDPIGICAEASERVEEDGGAHQPGGCRTEQAGS